MLSLLYRRYLKRHQNYEHAQHDWFQSAYWQSCNALSHTAHGRGTVWFIDSPLGKFVLRRYRRGGLIAKFNPFNFIYLGRSRTRAWQEFELLEYMHARGLPVPQVVAVEVNIRAAFYQAAIITETLPDTEELVTCLKQSRRINWYQIGRVIRQFHKQGIFHSDLNCHNILLDSFDKIWLIDFDKCTQRAVSTAWTQANLDRLHRSLSKEAKRFATIHFNEQHWQALLQGYHDDNT